MSCFCQVWTSLRLENKRWLCGYKCSEVLLQKNFNKIYTLFQSNEWKFCGTKIKSSTPCKALSEAGNEGVLILFFFQRPFPVTLSSGELVRDVQNFWGIDNFFSPPTLELDLLFVDSPLLIMILLLKERTETARSCMQTCNTCFISKDEVELQQDEENLPYEEEIYKDSSTFLKVSCFCNWKCSQSWPRCVKLFLQLMGSEIQL